jgi:hypothetical protein
LHQISEEDGKIKAHDNVLDFYFNKAVPKEVSLFNTSRSRCTAKIGLAGAEVKGIITCRKITLCQ